MVSAEATAFAKRSTPPSRTKTRRSLSELARAGEALAAEFLTDRGFTIIGRNVRVGRLELDVIARRGPLIVVCEVRSRRRARPVFPADTIVGQKLNRIRRATALWLRREKLGPVRVRIDAAAIVFANPESPELHYYENISYPFRG
ncbi:MAG: YraN family protein [Myxococcota bacterium]